MENSPSLVRKTVAAASRLAIPYLVLHEHLDGPVSIRYGPHVIATYEPDRLPHSLMGTGCEVIGDSVVQTARPF